MIAIGMLLAAVLVFLANVGFMAIVVFFSEDWRG